ncbi:hypothetical protein CG723_30150 [Streptomyces sp. CB01635]|nr:hypothetical protein CG723_30150 [Streptomyces sp. CB01635]
MQVTTKASARSSEKPRLDSSAMSSREYDLDFRDRASRIRAWGVGLLALAALLWPGASPSSRGCCPWTRSPHGTRRLFAGHRVGQRRALAEWRRRKSGTRMLPSATTHRDRACSRLRSWVRP